ncbi:MAG: J domain-containing protein [Candidatus Limnocylindrales bacterium]
MPFEADPYRTLGLAPGASLNEIRSAYRRLAKQHHPDAAGDRALPRFLAIRAAYERLVDGEGRLRRPGGGRGAAQEPRQADPARARASREAWRARWGGGAGTSRRAQPEDDAQPGGRRAGGERHRRPTRRATPGSTSYDEAAETQLDPAWDGGAWYGPNSGTYWTINPREYADPRKHGPEYLARARRAVGLTEDHDGDGRNGDETVPPPRAGPARPASPTARPTAQPDLGSVLPRLGLRRAAAAAAGLRRTAAAAAFATLIALAIAVPVAAALARGALPGTGVGEAILAVVVAVTWVVALVAGVTLLSGDREPPV